MLSPTQPSASSSSSKIKYPTLPMLSLKFRNDELTIKDRTRSANPMPLTPMRLASNIGIRRQNTPLLSRAEPTSSHRVKMASIFQHASMELQSSQRLSGRLSLLPPSKPGETNSQNIRRSRIPLFRRQSTRSPRRRTQEYEVLNGPAAVHSSPRSLSSIPQKPYNSPQNDKVVCTIPLPFESHLQSPLEVNKSANGRTRSPILLVNRILGPPLDHGDRSGSDPANRADRSSSDMPHLEVQQDYTDTQLVNSAASRPLSPSCLRNNEFGLESAQIPTPTELFPSPLSLLQKLQNSSSPIPTRLFQFERQFNVSGTIHSPSVAANDCRTIFTETLSQQGKGATRHSSDKENYPPPNSVAFSWSSGSSFDSASFDNFPSVLAGQKLLPRPCSPMQVTCTDIQAVIRQSKRPSRSGYEVYEDDNGKPGLIEVEPGLEVDREEDWVAPLTLKVECHRKGRSPRRERCQSYHEVDISADVERKREDSREDVDQIS